MNKNHNIQRQQETKHNGFPTLRFHTFNHCAANAKFQRSTGLNMLISVPHNKESDCATLQRAFSSLMLLKNTLPCYTIFCNVSARAQGIVLFRAEDIKILRSAQNFKVRAPRVDCLCSIMFDTMLGRIQTACSAALLGT